MSKKVVQHPRGGLMAEAAHERAVAGSAEAQTLQEAIFDAVREYSDFLDRQDVIWEVADDLIRLKAQALVIKVDYGRDAGSSIDISLKDGACEVFGNGTNPIPMAVGHLTSRIDEGAMTFLMTELRRAGFCADRRSADRN